jgi:hypothetical protein
VNAERAREVGEPILARISAEVARYGINLPRLDWSAGRFDHQRDPASGLDAIVARWDCEGRRLQLTLRPDGHIYGECDLLIDHPTKRGMWMDVLAIWGVPSALKCEPSLIKKPE